MHFLLTYKLFTSQKVFPAIKLPPESTINTIWDFDEGLIAEKIN